jgi:lipoprotein-anchoring transpeptidase ErfK/SrfK
MKSSKTTSVVIGLLLAALGVFASFAVVATAPAQTTDEGGTGTSTTNADQTTDQTVTAPLVFARKVTIGGVPVGGMTSIEARAAVKEAFGRALVLDISGRKVALFPAKVSARAGIDQAVNRAIDVTAGKAVKLHVHINLYELHRYLRKLAKRVYAKPVDPQVRLRHLRPWISEGRVGWSLKINEAGRLIRSAFAENRRTLLKLPVKKISRHFTKDNFGPVIVIRRGSNHLYLYNGMHYWRRFPIATGQSAYPTPLGHFQIVVMWRYPWWYPPNSPWAAGSKPVPPGPGNPLGTRWMGLSAPGVGIHGTPDASSVGYSESHGCIRMYIPDAEWLFDHVHIGTQVFIIAQ